jgi:hypothetical protein
MTEREKQRRAEQSRRDRERQGSFTIDEWCRFRRVSRAMFYKRPDLMPRTHSVGVKRIISDEADAEWLAAREAEGDSAAA